MARSAKERGKRIILLEHPVFVGDSGTLTIPFTAHHSGKLVVSFEYVDEVTLLRFRNSRLLIQLNNLKLVFYA